MGGPTCGCPPLQFEAKVPDVPSRAQNRLHGDW